MNIYKISFGSGFSWLNIIHVQASSEQEAIDKMINSFENENDMEYFVNPDKYNEDQYIIGGNHGLALHHDGLIQIEEIELIK